MADEFLDAIMQRTGDAGFDIQYSNKYARPTLEKLAADVRSKMDAASKTDRPAKRERKSRSESVRLTPEEQAYKDYDDARQKLTTFLGETLNTPKGISDENAALTEIVNSVSRGRREQQYAAPATSTPESPVPTPASSTGFNGEDLRRALIEAPPVPSPMTAPRESDVAALRKELLGAPPVQPAETAPRESDALAAYEDIETGNAPKAIIVDESETQAPEISEDRMSALFRKTMGTAFDPKSKMDIGKMKQLRDFVGGNPDLLDKSDTKIALDYYRTLK
jgi:hypothetical protein